MNVQFRKIARGPAWERWLITEDQHGDIAIAGEAILTYMDLSGYSDVECDIMFARDLDEVETEELLKAAVNILSGQGNIVVFTTRQVISQEFSLVEDEGPDEFEDNENN